MRHEIELGDTWLRGHVLKDNMAEEPVAGGEAAEQREAEGEGVERAGAGEADRDGEAVLLDEADLLDGAGAGGGVAEDVDAREDLLAEQCLDGQELELVELPAAIGVGAWHELDDLGTGEHQLGGDARPGDPELGTREAALVCVREGGGGDADDYDGDGSEEARDSRGERGAEAAGARSLALVGCWGDASSVVSAGASEPASAALGSVAEANRRADTFDL
ncbi:hypothetical protein [Nannocystis bainbridge]|uniref:Uncharacterized protein n=1 Tax=Nannocystis bainbridge TaxID=2995303 RepID=A0ABT5E4F4_9BACT|nr:hypothetical protein [Nannocystis bainbridge]MDC0719596.1 hypothetical protein [Nannocystis bainbridge]